MQIDIDKVKIEPSWKEILKEDFLSPNFARVKENFLRAKAAGEVYPPNALIFNAFNLTPFNAVKVVILGQDPYHGAGHQNPAQPTKYLQRNLRRFGYRGAKFGRSELLGEAGRATAKRDAKR